MYKGRREQWKQTTKPELITRTVFRCLRRPPRVLLTDDYITTIGKEVARDMMARVAGESGDVGFLPSNWEWTGLFAQQVRACVKPMGTHLAGCIDFAHLERVYFGAPATSANAPDSRASQVIRLADVANQVRTGAVHVSRDVAPIHGAHTRVRPVATPSHARPKRARKS